STTTTVNTKIARNTVSATIRAIARPPTSAIALSDVFMPSAAMAVTRHQRETLLSATKIGTGTMPRLLIRTSATKLAARLTGAVGAKDKGQRHHHRQQHRHAQQLDEGGNIAGFFGHGKTSPDHLSDVVNRAAEEHADRRVVETKERNDQRVDDHRHRAQR